MEKNKILILTEASEKIGFGHLNRCIFLSKKLKKFFKIFFISKYEIKKYLPKNYSFSKLNSFKKEEHFDCIIIDLKKINTKYFSFLKNLKTKNRIVISYKEEKKINPQL